MTSMNHGSTVSRVVVASFDRPLWATGSEPSDGGISWTLMAAASPAEISKTPHERLTVELVQDDFFDAAEGSGDVVVTRHPAQILIGGHVAIAVESVPELIAALSELAEAHGAV